MKTATLIALGLALSCAGTRPGERSVAVGAEAPHFTAVDHLGEERDLRTLWETGPVVLTFLRSFY